MTAFFEAIRTATDMFLTFTIAHFFQCHASIDYLRLSFCILDVYLDDKHGFGT